MSSNAQSGTSCSDGAGGVAKVFNRVLDHWFGPTACEWHWSRRFAFTLAGSITFFLAWSVHIYGVTGVASVPDLRIAATLFLVVSTAVGATWFAGLTAWKDLSYGPVRLYLSGFLLPYLVWSLIVIMFNRELPELAK